MPFVLLAFSLMIYVKFKSQIQNLVIGNGRLGFEAIDAQDERFISKRLAGLLKYQYQMGSQGLSSNLIEVQLVE